MLNRISYFILIPVLLLSGCDTNGKDGLSPDISSVNINNDIWIVENFPLEFVFLDYTYRYAYYTEGIDHEEFGELVGYLINQRDLAKWIEIDKPKTYQYSVIENNEVIRDTCYYACNPILENRFELLAKSCVEIELVAVKRGDSYSIFTKGEHTND
jgi:hypothetical protein